MAISFLGAHRLARLRWLLLPAAAAAIQACSGETDPLSSATSLSSVSSVEVSPGDLTGPVGQISQFTARVRDENGRILTDRVVSWSSSDTSIARVNSSGMGTAVGVGTARIVATVGGKSGSARTTVAAANAVDAPPGTVTDLQVTGANDTSATLTFTEVTAQGGQAASYEFRMSPGTIGWGSAATVSRGTCLSPVAGVASGNRRTCVVAGLTKATAYDFQLRAFRITSGRDTVFGGLSNVGRAVTTGAVAGVVATIVVTPGSDTRAPAETGQFVATLRDASGNSITDRGVTWSTTNPAVASIDATGLVTAAAPGTTSIVATADGRSGAATLTVAGGAPAAAWPNEPAGFTMMTDQPFDALTSQSWNVTSNPLGLLSIGSDGSAPASPSSVLQFRYPSGYTGGGAPGTAYYGHSAAKEVYAGFYWKPSNPWQNHPSNVNKVTFWQSESWGNSVYLEMYGPGPYHLDAAICFPAVTHLMANVNRSEVTLGAWHRVEWHLKYATSGGSADGVMEWWLDGVLQGRYTNIQTPADRGFVEYQISPTWGGLDGLKTENDYFLYDHVKLSRK